MCPPECRTVTIHVDVFGRAHPSGNSNLCPMPLQLRLTLVGSNDASENKITVLRIIIFCYASRLSHLSPFAE